MPMASRNSPPTPPGSKSTRVVAPTSKAKSRRRKKPAQPPGWPWASKTTVASPAAWRRAAVAIPAMPAPTSATSYMGCPPGRCADTLTTRGNRRRERRITANPGKEEKRMPTYPTGAPTPGQEMAGGHGGQAVPAGPAFLFDLDGTLVDSVYQHVLAWLEALEACGIELS